MNRLTVILGVAMVIAPFLFDYSTNPAALWTSFIMGTIIAALSYLQHFRWAMLAGMITFFLPPVLGFSGVSPALWTCLIVGSLVATLAGYQGFLSDEAEAGWAQQRQV